MLDPFKENPFLVLGLPTYADQASVIKRWKILTKDSHPDKNAEEAEINTIRTQVFNSARDRALSNLQSSAAELAAAHYATLSEEAQQHIIQEAKQIGVVYETVWIEERWAGRQRAKNIQLENERVAQVRAENDKKEKDRIETIHREAARIDAKRAENDAEEDERIEAKRAENDRIEAERIALIHAEAARIEATRAKNDADEKARIEAMQAKNNATEKARFQKLEEINSARALEHRQSLWAENDRKEAERMEKEIADNDARETIRITRKIAENDAEEDERIEAKRAENDLQCAAEIENKKTPKKRKHSKIWTSEQFKFCRNKIHTFVAENLKLDPTHFTKCKDLLAAFTALHPEENPDPNFFFRSLHACVQDLDANTTFSTTVRACDRGYKGFCIRMD